MYFLNLGVKALKNGHVPPKKLVGCWTTVKVASSLRHDSSLFALAEDWRLKRRVQKADLPNTLRRRAPSLAEMPCKLPSLTKKKRRKRQATAPPTLTGNLAQAMPRHFTWLFASSSVDQLLVGRYARNDRWKRPWQCLSFSFLQLACKSDREYRAMELCERLPDAHKVGEDWSAAEPTRARARRLDRFKMARAP